MIDRDCPLCGAHKWEIASSPLDNTKKSYYSKILRRLASVEHDTIRDSSKTYACLICGLLVRYPFFGSDLLTRLYLDAAPVHRAGWRNFLAALADDRADRSDVLRQLWLDTCEFLPPVETYAEFGCPFQGLIVSRFASPEARRSVRRQLTSGPRRNVASPSAIANGRLIAYVNRLTAPRGRRKGAATHQDLLGGITQFVVTDGSITRWGLGCVQFGQTCWQVSCRLSESRVIGMAELRSELGERRLSLLAFFDTLDHTRDLREVVDWALDVSDAILIVSHDITEATLQHEFAFTGSALSYVAQMRPGWSVRRGERVCDDKGKSTWLVCLLVRSNVGLAPRELS